MKALNTVPFVSVENMMRLVLELGVETCIEQIAGYIEADFAKWEDFDKCPRIGSHSEVGVIELMPTSDGIDYGFKYVNGHPTNMFDGGTWYRDPGCGGINGIELMRDTSSPFYAMKLCC